MPKRIDHDLRRRQIAEALWRLVAANGMEAVSLRQVAAGAGVSMGMVQHYFTDKEEMVLFALSSLTEQVGRRVGEALADQDDPLQRVRAVLVQTLPLDDERRLEARVAVTFLARAPVDEKIAAHLRSGYAEGHAYLVEQLRAAGVPDAEQEAFRLVALTDGLTAHTLAGHHAPAEALAVLDEHLARL
ncbi:TetR/AcrR family transcriptional regulator [Umezawaea endophytica]|uniref:TetR/AcrR family transcriptional regulator n=1 Tax=Umezawaea endophytica TaxID=1654476 RepID=A0A9X2VKG7_9PSEU|nr:TetR/AcrR family transcriptional regulator [Umezawaea endophytica]MCS7477727.1 TetR/AcrR family transcriptional regulator [Umezawaea endophytica]